MVQLQPTVVGVPHVPAEPVEAGPTGRRLDTVSGRCVLCSLAASMTCLPPTLPFPSCRRTHRAMSRAVELAPPAGACASGWRMYFACQAPFTLTWLTALLAAFW